MSGAAFEYTFPAIRGIQAGREYYVSMCPLRLIPKIFLFDEEEMVPELRAQRTLNWARIPEMTDYLVSNRQDYVFSALTASVDAELRFEPYDPKDVSGRLGLLHIPMDGTFIINDGQHRRAAIDMAIKECPDLADETIAVVFFLDTGLKRCQQMFADLNRYAIRPSRSLGLLYDHGNPWAEVTRRLVEKAMAFKDVVEMEKSALSLRSSRLFTFSAIYGATKKLLANNSELSIEKRVELAQIFWDEVDKNIPEWNYVRTKKISSGEIRQDYLHTNSAVLSAIAHVGMALLAFEPKVWKKKLEGMRNIDWRRSNSNLWEGRVLRNGKVYKSNESIILTANTIKEALGLDLNADEQAIENKLMRNDQ